MTSVEEFNCILCKESFDTKDELQIHFRKHGDPKFNESIKSKSRVQNDAPDGNEKSNDASEMVNCDVCEEMFPTISKAITHKHKVHPEHDAKYFCPWCGKLFTMKHLYNKHLQTNHDATDGIQGSNDNHFHCDTCDVYFFIPAAMVYHNKFFHRQDTDLPIIGYSKKQKLCNQDLLPVYYCSFCGEEYINKVNLHKHICDDHGDENQRPSDVLRCPLCEAIFYHLDAYELHLTFHSSEDLYSETNEMNESDMTEFSLETVPPVMERVEDLNNLSNLDTDVNAIGIENFLQMAMDEPHDSNEVLKKVKSKKHKKHKKSKKSAITLDEFLNMNQDVFGEDLDFQGIEEVPTKVIARQLKSKKPPMQKSGAKLVSSADLQKLQNQGIVVKMRSGNRPPTLQNKPYGQAVKVSPHVKQLTNQTKTKAISASNEVLSKLMNQSSNQLKIIKKTAQEHANIDQRVVDESVSEDTNTKPLDEEPAHPDEMGTDCNVSLDQKTNLTPIGKPLVLEDKQNNKQLNASEVNQEAQQFITAKSDIMEVKQDINTSSNENYGDMTKTHSHKMENTSINQNVTTANNMKDTLKNISKQITIKPVIQTNKTGLQDDPESVSQRVDKNEDRGNEASQIEINTNQILENPNNKTLDTLKNRNSAITIKSLKNKSIVLENRSIVTMDENQGPNSKIIPANIDVLVPTVEKSEESMINKQEHSKDKQIQMANSAHVLKNLSKNITIKSMSPSIKPVGEESETNREPDYSDFDEREDEKPTENKNIKQATQQHTTPIILKNISPRHKLSPDVSKSTPHSSYANTRTGANEEEKVSDCEQFSDSEIVKNTNVQSSSNILKHLKNITAKPVPVAKNIYQQITARSSNTTMNIAKGNNFNRQSLHKNEFSEEIEIFNIDDSDSDGAVGEQQKLEQNISAPKTFEPIKSDVKSKATLNAIKNISKYVTVKSSNSEMKQMTHSVNKHKLDFELFSDEEDIHNDALKDSYDHFEDTPITNISKVTSTPTTKQIADPFKRVFKNLGKHITVKSRNESPSPSFKSPDQVMQHFSRNIAPNDVERDDEPFSGKVKITEITEDNVSDGDINHAQNCENKGIVTQSPEDSNSDNEHLTEDMDESDEYESEIRGNLIKTPNLDLKSNNKFLKNISKNITVKSLSEKSGENQGRKTTQPEKEIIVNQGKLSKDLSIKPIKQNKSEIQNESVKFKTQNSVYNEQNIEATTSSNQSMNPKVAKSPDVVNTVNREVKMKTFQSETVIEEITTTVTKTIRRVNQVNQQVYNASQTSSAPRIIQQKNGARMTNYNQSPKNFQGITVRQSAPAMCPKIRQTIPFRPSISTSVRPSSQLVPNRPNANLVRPSRMQVKNMPHQQRPTGKPLKISPNAMNQTLKRPYTEETSGPFSCFKKPKESLFPVNETAFDSRSDFHHASSSQSSKFCSSTKIVKDNAVVTSQQKSESISQQQQISRTSSISGLKIMKAKQVSQVEKCEISASKRTTLEAIEKLQKQGLLVKKPRIEDCEPPNSDSDDNDKFLDED